MGSEIKFSNTSNIPSLSEDTWETILPYFLKTPSDYKTITAVSKFFHEKSPELTTDHDLALKLAQNIPRTFLQLQPRFTNDGVFICKVLTKTGFPLATLSENTQDPHLLKCIVAARRIYHPEKNKTLSLSIQDKNLMKIAKATHERVGYIIGKQYDKLTQYDWDEMSQVEYSKIDPNHYIEKGSKIAIKTKNIHLSELTENICRTLLQRGLKNAEEIVRDSVNSTGMHFDFSDIKEIVLSTTQEPVEDNTERMLETLKKEPKQFGKICSLMKDHINFAKKAIQETPELFPHASSEMKDTKEIALLAIKAKPQNMLHIGKSLLDNKAFTLEAFESNNKVYNFATQAMKKFLFSKHPILALKAALENSKF